MSGVHDDLATQARRALDEWYTGAPGPDKVVMYAENLIGELRRVEAQVARLEQASRAHLAHAEMEVATEKVWRSRAEAAEARGVSGDPLTAEYERNLRRDHERGHPGGLTPISKRPCTICLLLAQLSHERAEVARLRDGLRLPLQLLHGIDYEESSRIDQAVIALEALAEDGAAHPWEKTLTEWIAQVPPNPEDEGAA